MSQIQNWALGVCLACAAAGVLQQVFTAKSHVIKLVLTLYILVTALGAAGKPGIWPDFSAPYDTSTLSEEAQVDVESLTLAQAAQALEQTLSQALAEDGIAAEDIRVYLFADESGEVSVKQVDIALMNDKDSSSAQAVIQSMLGQQTQVSVKALQREE